VGVGGGGVAVESHSGSTYAHTDADEDRSTLKQGDPPMSQEGSP
jgi:hypothetical protein